MTRKILITGSSGFIGSALRRLLIANGDEVVSFDHLDGCDVTDREAVAKAVAQVDAVINLAGRLGTSETFGAETPTAEVNIIGALNVADACIDRHPMVQIGTGHKGQPNPYAITKACAEDLLLARAEQTLDPINVVRAFHAYGPGQKAFPPHGKSGVRKIIPSFVCRALTGMPIEINGSGNQMIDLVHVDLVAEVLVAALDAPYGRLLEAGTGVGIPVNAVARQVIELTGSSSEIVHLNQRAGEPDDSVVVASVPECRHAFPWGMEETIDYYRGIVGQ